MTISEALIQVISSMEIGTKFRYETKADIKEAIYGIIGHYPRQVEFDKALEDILKNHNPYNFGYLCGVGWFRSAVKSRFKTIYQNQINKRRKKQLAIT